LIGLSSQADRTDGHLPLELHAITKQFGSVTALDRVSLGIRRGSVHALLGENGAGKTTLMRIAFGLLAPDEGWITVDGTKRHIASPAHAISLGIGMVHQQFSLIPAMTVAENVALGGRGRYSTRDAAAVVLEIAERTGLKLKPAARVADLGSADRQKLEIIRTLAHNATVMILDEPTAVLTSNDVTEFFSRVRSFADQGGSVILITHKLRDALEHADQVTVLRRGEVVMTSAVSEATEISLMTAMLGSAPVREPRGSTAPGKLTPVAHLKTAILGNDREVARAAIDLEIRGGEIVGIAALEGAASPLLRTLAGRQKPLSGAAHIPEEVGFVPENRHDEALIAGFSLTENLALQGAGEKRGLLDWQALESETEAVISRFDVRNAAPDVTPDKLSGGNQQRFVLGRELQKKPLLLVLENPTQGLDVNAAAFVHDRMRLARSEGIAVVFYSSDLDELAELSDRVLVVSGRGIVEAAPDRRVIGRILLGAGNPATAVG
jgi:ABC-type uncharacterized transport system ATPase subunit